MSNIFSVSHDCVTCNSAICDHYVTGVAVILHSLPKFKIKKSKSENQNKMKGKMEKKNKGERQ